MFVIWKFEAKRLRNLATKKQKKNQLPPTVTNPKVIEVGFRRLETKRVGGHEMQKPLLCFLLPTFAPLDREREGARGRQFAFCMMQERLH